jgi:pyruvate,water dikinase
VGADLRARVAARQARRALLAGSPLISPLTLRPKPDRSPALLTGAAAGGGRATGPVRVVRDASGFGSLRPGEVLVAPWTNPSWTPLFGVAGAVVVDTGGPASHAAIVAREYGIPAVVGTGNGTSVLQDGTVVIVDGSQGRVLEAP